jgi:hypothetical protein
MNYHATETASTAMRQISCVRAVFRRRPSRREAP